MLYIKEFSYNDYLTYKIKKGDNLKSVSEELKIDSYFLRAYHNKHCPLKDLIEKDLPSHLELIIIQSQEEKDAKELYREKVLFSSKDYKLPFKPRGFERLFLVLYTIENGKKKTSINEEVLVKWLATDSNGYSFFEINRVSKVYVDGKEYNSVVDELAEKAASVFYPLRVVIDSDGEWVDIHDFDTIRERWPQVKNNLIKEFRGKPINDYLEIFEKKLQDDSVIFDSFAKDWFLRAFFSGLNIEYKENLTFKNQINFPVSSKIGDVSFNVEQDILPELDKYNLINITQNGKLVDIRNKIDFENNVSIPYDSIGDSDSEKLEGTYTAHYFLNLNSYMIDSLFLECKIDLDLPQILTIVMSSVDDEAKLTLNSRVSLLVEQKEEKKLSFFTNLLEVLTGK